MKHSATALCTLGLLILSGCTTPVAATHDVDAQTIRDIEVAWNKDWAAKDMDKICAHYADDANVLVSGMPIFSGKDKIHEGMKQLLSDPNLNLKFEAAQIEIAKEGDLAYTRGAYSWTMTDPNSKKPVTEKGKYVTIYRKGSDGSWKAVQDMNNADGPPTPAA